MMKLRKPILMATLIAMVLGPLHQPLAQAQQGGGFNTPGTGGEPFGGKAGERRLEDLFDADDDLFADDEEDAADEILRQRLEQKIRERMGGGNNSAPPSAPSQREQSRNQNRAQAPTQKSAPRNQIDFNRASDAAGTSITQGASSKIIPGAQSKTCLKLDIETGYGPDVITNFDFPDADIIEIAKTLGKLTCLNFILDKDVRGRISVVSNSPITVGDAWKAFLTALDVNGFSIIPSGKYLRIARTRDAKDKQIKTYSGAFTPDSDIYITRVIPLKYINAEEVRRVFSNFMPPNTRIIAYDQTNTLIITDTGANIKRIMDMLSILDVEGYDEKLEVIRIKYASAQDIAKLIDQLLPGPPSGHPAAAARFRGAVNFSARKTKEGGVISNILPDERTNSVIVSANAKGLEQVRELIRKLDAKVTASQGGSKIHVVYLQYADAKKVAETLSNLTATAGQAPRGSANPVVGAGTPITAQLFEGAIKISADEATNSLVITGTPGDFQTVSRVIQKLDVPRDQVYVEAVIMEMSMDDNFSFGTSIASPKNGVGFIPNSNLAEFLANPLTTQGAFFGFKKGGESVVTVTQGTAQTDVTVSNIMGLIKLLQTHTNANVLATPQILTLDNQQASIEITENIPVPQVTAIQGSTQTGFTMQKVSLSLQIKPQINKISNFVKLDIKQRMEDITNKAPKALADQAIATLSRASETTVIVQDGDTVALGGLTRDKVDEQETKVPLLGDIPILGWLFKSRATQTTKQNLIVFITPQIIKQYQNIRKIVDRKISERDKFIDRIGGEDPHKESVKEMIDRMPPVSELRSGNKIESSSIGRDEEQAAETQDDVENTWVTTPVKRATSVGTQLPATATSPYGTQVAPQAPVNAPGQNQTHGQQNQAGIQPYAQPPTQQPGQTQAGQAQPVQNQPVIQGQPYAQPGTAPQQATQSGTQQDSSSSTGTTGTTATQQQAQPSTSAPTPNTHE